MPVQYLTNINQIPAVDVNNPILQACIVKSKSNSVLQKVGTSESPNKMPKFSYRNWTIYTEHVPPVTTGWLTIS